MFRTPLILMLCVAAPFVVADDEPTEEPQAKVKAGPDDKYAIQKQGPIDKDAPTEFQTTPSGLKYRILRKSAKKKPTPADSVTVNYKGWLDNDKIFDTSYRRSKKATFPLGGVIRGWTEGLQLIGQGGMIELEIPPELGYGRRGSPGAIPPNARLHFLVELHEIN